MTPTKAPAAPRAAARPQTMRAAVLENLNAPLRVDTVAIPPLAVGQVLVKIAASGICGKQIDEITGKRGEDPYLPHLLGHEGAGTVVETGPGVTKVKPGDAVVIHWIKSTGIDAASPKFSRDGQKIEAGCATTFSEYSIVAENRATKIPAGIPFDAAALLGCAVTTGLGIVFNDLKLLPGQSIAVWGAGGVGLNAVQGAALVNAYPIIAVDVHEGKLKRAKEFGATHAVNAATEDAAKAIRKILGGAGLSAAVDTTGDVKVIETAFDLSDAKSGTVLLAGVPRHDGRVTIDSFTLHHGRRIFGSHGGDTKPDRDIPRYLTLFTQGRLKLKELITHRFPLDKVNEAVETVRKGDAGRVLIEMR